DGVCAGTSCLAPWQLVALESFTNHQPLATVPDLRFGFSAEQLKTALHSAGSEPLVRIETETYSMVGGKVARLSRLRRARAEPDARRVRDAVRAAERHIISAQRKDGRFRYGMNPLTGDVDWASLSLPRQAGTTLALCELGASRRS